MTPEALFTAALQLESGWKVARCRFEGEPRRLLLELDFEEGKRFGCPQCGKLCPPHDTSIKRWRHLNFFQYECLLEARVPRSHCPEHGVLSVAVLQLAKRLARGFRSLRYFRIMAYLKAAGLHLDLPSLKPSPLTHSK